MFYLRKTTDKPVTYGLFRQDQNGRSEEVIDNIKDMQLYFATRNNLQHYLAVARITDWQQVKKIKVVLTFMHPINKNKQTIFIIGPRN